MINFVRNEILFSSDLYIIFNNFDFLNEIYIVPNIFKTQTTNVLRDSIAFAMHELCCLFRIGFFY